MLPPGHRRLPPPPHPPRPARVSFEPQVRVYKEHSKTVLDLRFDAAAEYLASASADGTVVVVGLCCSDGEAEVQQRLRLGYPATVRCCSCCACMHTFSCYWPLP